jgi:flagella basal body P-ring formation protein FlgA
MTNRTRSLALALTLTVLIVGTSAVRAARGAYADSSAFQSVPGSQVAALADRIAHETVSGPDRSVAPAFTIANQSVSSGTLSIAAAGTPQVYPSYLVVPIAILVDGKLARTVFAGYRITQYIHTAVAMHDLTAGAVLTADDLTTGRVASVGRPAVDPSLLVGRKLHVSLARGSMIFPEMTNVNEIVKAGQPCILIVHDGPVALSADVVARTSGGMGEQVGVYNPDTRHALSGTVTGPGKVELVLPGDGSSE